MGRLTEMPNLTSTETADLLDVHPSTVKRWCNDGDLAFRLTEGGHRRIDLTQALAFAKDRGITTRLTPFHPFEAHVWRAFRPVRERGSYERLVGLAMGWVHRRRIHQVERLYGELSALPEVTLVDFLDLGVRGLMVEVGRAWHEGRLRAGEEHLVSQMMMGVLIRLAARRADERERRQAAEARKQAPAIPVKPPVALVGTLEGNLHHLGAMCVRLVLESAGWDVGYLGPDVPLEDIAALQRDHEAALVCVSLSPTGAAGEYVRTTRLLGDLYDRSRPFHLAFGGPAADPLPEGDPSPFLDCAVYGSCREFDAALATGWARGAGMEAAG